MKTMPFFLSIFLAASGAYAQASLGEARFITDGGEVAVAANWEVDQGEAVDITASGANNYDYLISGITGLTPNTTSAFTSQGNSLTVANGGTLLICSNNGGPGITKNITIPGLTINGGTLKIKGGSSTNYTFKEPLSFLGVSTIDRGDGTYTQQYTFDTTAAISGSGSLYIKRTTNGSTSPNYAVTINSDNNTYTGQVILSTTNLASSFNLNKPLGSGVSYLLEDAGSNTWNFNISNGALVGASRMTFNRANATTTINGASVALPTLSGTGGTINASGTLTVNQAEDGVLNSALTGSLSLIKEGQGKLTLGGNSSFTGGLTVNGGEVVLTSFNAAGSGTLTINNGGDFILGPARPGKIIVNAPTVIHLYIGEGDFPITRRVLFPNLVETNPGDVTFVVEVGPDGRTYETEIIDSQLWLIGVKGVSGEARLKVTNTNINTGASWSTAEGDGKAIFTEGALSYDYIINNSLVGLCELNSNNATFTSQANSLTVQGGVLGLRSGGGTRYYVEIPNLTIDNGTLRFGMNGSQTARIDLNSPVLFKGSCEWNRATNASYSPSLYLNKAIFGDADTTLTLTRSGNGGTGSVFCLNGTGSDYKGELILGIVESSNVPTFSFDTAIGPALLKVNNTTDKAWTVNVAAGVCDALRGIQVVAGKATFDFKGANTLAAVDFGDYVGGEWKGTTTLTLNQTQDGTFGATLGDGLNLTKQGAATLTVTGALTTTGGVTVGESTLELADSVTGTAAIQVNDGATLMYGSGSSELALTALAGSTLQPLDLDDALSVASLALPAEGTVTLDIAEPLLHPEGVKRYFLKAAGITGVNDREMKEIFTGLPKRCELGADETGLYVINPPQGLFITLY